MLFFVRYVVVEILWEGTNGKKSIKRKKKEGRTWNKGCWKKSKIKKSD
jgi:hypothetical protein